MSREIAGSAFEQGDGERRTWDEMGWWEQPFAADDDVYPDDEEYVDDEDDDPTTSRTGCPDGASRSRRLGSVGYSHRSIWQGDHSGHLVLRRA